jgi:glycerol uptake facilitator-like aquaporin
MSQEIILALISLVGGIIGGLAVNVTIEGVKKQTNKNINNNKQSSNGDHSPNSNTNNFGPKQ